MLLEWAEAPVAAGAWIPPWQAGRSAESIPPPGPSTAPPAPDPAVRGLEHVGVYLPRYRGAHPPECDRAEP